MAQKVQKPRRVTGAVETGDDWIAKQAAAKLLGVSVRQIENRAARGEIEKRVLPKAAGERAARVEYSRPDVERIRAGAPRVAASNGVTITALVPARPSAVRRAELPAPADPFAGLAAQLAAIAAAFPAPGKWMSLKAAAEYSGLPARYLVGQARAGQLRARNVGVKRERWMFTAEGLN